jgi:redox-sensing transcriptional repressor
LGGVGLQPGRSEAEPGPSERLSLGVAARLSRYLQVLTQAKKMGKDTISSQELADYTHVNSTQIRRDLSGFGKFGKRGVGYNVDALLSQIRRILRTSGQHNIALFGAGHLGRAIAGSDIFAEHGFRVVAVFDSDPDKAGEPIGSDGELRVRPYAGIAEVVEQEGVVVGVLAVPTAAAQAVADGVDEVDVVAPWRSVLEGDDEALARLVAATAEACGDRTLKVILETGSHPDPVTTRAMADAALIAGAFFLKTSTGKYGPGADLGSARVLLEAVRDFGAGGVKVSGGVRTAEQADDYLRLAAALLGEEEVTPERFRIGASSLLDALLAAT